MIINFYNDVSHGLVYFRSQKSPNSYLSLSLLLSLFFPIKCIKCALLWFFFVFIDDLAEKCKQAANLYGELKITGVWNFQDCLETVKPLLWAKNPISGVYFSAKQMSYIFLTGWFWIFLKSVFRTSVEF